MDIDGKKFLVLFSWFRFLFQESFFFFLCCFLSHSSLHGCMAPCREAGRASTSRKSFWRMDGGKA